MRALAIALDYRAATTAGNAAGRASAAGAAEAYLADPAMQALPKPDFLPGGLQIARRVLIAEKMAGDTRRRRCRCLRPPSPPSPRVLDFQMVKLRLLAQAGDAAGSGALLKEMVVRFPDNDEVKAAMIAWYMSQRDVDGAEAFLRQLAGDATGPTTGTWR